jgi:transcriptional regulator with XRE-family HTH domain
MTESNDPLVLRREISAILDKVTDRGSLLFFHWLIANIHKNEELPPPEELKKLHGVFIRVVEAFRTKKKISPSDWELMSRWVGTIGNDVDISRHLASTVKFYRKKAALTRLQLAKTLRISLKTVLALERRRIKDMSLPRLFQLAHALSVDAGEFMDRIYKLEQAAGKWKDCLLSKDWQSWRSTMVEVSAMRSWRRSTASVNRQSPRGEGVCHPSNESARSADQGSHPRR